METSVGIPINIQYPGVDSVNKCDSKGSTFDEERAQENFDDFILSLPIDDLLEVLLKDKTEDASRQRHQ